MDQLNSEWQDYTTRFEGVFRVTTVQGVYKVKFPVKYSKYRLDGYTLESIYNGRWIHPLEPHTEGTT